ncbi:asparaginase [Bacillus sp. FJAT-49711]|uniref:asparaginase n=1 Tax=Bacillus sp. FJAT-49711 TaxID=2833585 RepID=UPI001BC8F185|nr:asparaginase [Bacillus sp. FJAT-49711]MBS4218611.1 asparaginase [Bacillus sp. FJAT-49711]
MQYEVLIEEMRNGLVENIHSGIICGVNDQLQSIYQVGGDDQYVYFRSAAKPIQAIPIFLSNIISKYNITDEEAALFTASQRGETYHIAALESLLNKLPVKEEELFCPASYPLNAVPKEAMIREQKSKRRLYHNCAGKHLGFATMCRELDFPVEGYWEESHPLQQKILSILSELSEVPQSKIKTGVDGCGVPVFAIPLKNMAITYLKLACPDLIADQDMQEAVKKMTNVMNLHPNIVASEDFVCSVLLRDDNIVAKGGAQGVYCFGLKKERIGFALKVLSGSEDVWPNVLAAILEQIGYSNKQTIASLRDIRPSVIKNDAGIVVGEIKEKFTL